MTFEWRKEGLGHDVDKQGNKGRNTGERCDNYIQWVLRLLERHQKHHEQKIIEQPTISNDSCCLVSRIRGALNKAIIVDGVRDIEGVVK